ncbi:MAG TPA: arginine deiminase family protein [Pyrinomonadaceae bacterium]
MPLLEMNYGTYEALVGDTSASTTGTTPTVKFSALIGAVSHNINDCQLTYCARENIDYDKACAQLEEYRQLLRTLDVELIQLDAVDSHPDCCFVQDTAVMLDEICVIASMGAPARAQETLAVERLLARHRPTRRILPPATLDGGDVVQIGRRLFVGASTRTNARGIARLEELVQPFGYVVVPVKISGALHLTTGCGIVDDETVIVNPRWLDASAFKGVRQLHVSEDEPWAANTVRVGSTVCVERQASRTIELLQRYVRNVATLDISEFHKAEGSLSCLSLLFKRDQ